MSQRGDTLGSQWAAWDSVAEAQSLYPRGQVGVTDGQVALAGRRKQGQGITLSQDQANFLPKVSG